MTEQEELVQDIRGLTVKKRVAVLLESSHKLLSGH
jgi:hypothetical protein